MNLSELSTAIASRYDEDLIPRLVDYVRVPAKSPAFDPNWAEHGYLGQVVASAREWAAAQSWSNGIVGMWGASYMAISQLFTAAQQPPHLRAIFPIVPMGDSYRDMVFPG